MCSVGGRPGPGLRNTVLEHLRIVPRWLSDILWRMHSYSRFISIVYIPMCQCKNKADTKNINKYFKINIKMWLYSQCMKEITRKWRKKHYLNADKTSNQQCGSLFPCTEYCPKHTNRCVPTSHAALPYQDCAKHNEFSISVILGIMGYFIIIDGDKHGFGQDKPHNEL